MTFSTGQPNHRSLRAIVAEGTQPLAVWIGAGLSVDAGLPTWVQLRKVLERAGKEKAADLDGEESERLSAELNAIERHPEHWVAFERLRELLGPTSFTTTIRSALSASADSAIPTAYTSVWEAGAQIVLTLNLDDLARRGHAAVHSGRRSLITTDGRKAAQLDGYTQRTNHVVANLHGTLEDSQSWVMTRTDLRELMRRESYPEFLRRVLHGYCNVFVGMSADDVAVGSQLERLRDMDTEVGHCFWLSNRRDVVTDTWAERAGMRLIRYTPEPDHSTQVTEFLADLRDARPEPELVPPPVAPTMVDSGDLPLSVNPIPSPFAILAEPADQVRVHLNREATRILNGGGKDVLAEYESFCAKYEEAIYRAWFVSTTPGSNALMGYQLDAEVAAGAFGRVFRARDSQGDLVAVKLLRHEIRGKSELLQSFRRGVRSMEILSERGVQSMVPYRGAAEIPSMVVMDWVDGPNLSEAKESSLIDDWDTLLKICGDLSAVILGAHQVPERVLHRDLRPANVMLRQYWEEPTNFEVVVLDFDLSWHQGAENRSVQYSTALGYLAPEQRGMTNGSTRRAAVDVYGLGMTFWFLLTGNDPVPDQHLHGDFDAKVHEAAERFASTSWKSLASRFARLVSWMVQNDQDARPDLQRVIDEVAALRNANSELTAGIPIVLEVEELAARTDYFRGYVPSDDGLRFTAASRRGIEARLDIPAGAGNVRLDVSWARTGVEERTGLNKYVARAESAVRSRLASSGWTVQGAREAGQSFSIAAQRGRFSSDELDQAARGLDEALDLISFD